MSLNEEQNIASEIEKATQDHVHLVNKLQTRLHRLRDHDQENFTPDKLESHWNLLNNLPPQVVSLLDEDTIPDAASLEAARTLSNTLDAFGRNLYSLDYHGPKIIIAGAGDIHLTSTMILNATKYDWEFRNFPGQGWSIAIDKKGPHVPYGTRPLATLTPAY